MTQRVVGARHRNLNIFAAGATLQVESVVKRFGHIRHRNTILRALGTRQAWHHGFEFQSQRVGIGRIDAVATPPQALRLRIGFHQRHRFRRPIGKSQVVDGFLIDRKEAAGRTVFGRHVGNGGAIGKRQLIEAVAEKFDELADDTLLAQHFDNPQHQIGRGDAFRQPAGQFESDNVGNQHRNGLAKHRGLGFDPADAPPQHAEPIDHSRVAIGTDQRIRIGDLAPVHLFGPHHLGEILQVHLMTNTGARGHHAKVIKCRLAPTQEPVAFLVTRHLDFDIRFKRRSIAELVHHDRVVDDEIDRR